MAGRFAEPLPAEGRPLAEVAARLARDVVEGANRLSHPMYMGHQVSAPLPAAVWAESVIAALNNSMAVAEMSPTGTPLERQVVRWLCDLAGSARARAAPSLGRDRGHLHRAARRAEPRDPRRVAARGWGRARRWWCAASTRTTR
jgi:hypothetical protein